MSSIGAICLVCDLYGTNFYKFYGRFEEFGLLYLVSVFHWLKEFGFDVLLGIDVKVCIQFFTYLVLGFNFALYLFINNLSNLKVKYGSGVKKRLH
ncbi:hypothetical protein [Flavobacterium chryseum]|uniref:hypothetical protein n=1 Tax=Flavobacterium sp. P3160 TaxID=2512113 RepID=UPI00105D9034|nr:hypothetical protein [Flavobacterium sp. P3160]